MKNVLPFGYEYVDGKIVVNPIAGAILKFRVEKNLEYSSNPPKVLIEEVMVDALADGQTLTEEEAKAKVSAYAIDRYVVAEIMANPEWKEYLESTTDRADTYRGTIKSFKTDKGVTVMAHDGIIDRETWETAQGKMKEAMEARFGKIAFDDE